MLNRRKFLDAVKMMGLSGWALGTGSGWPKRLEDSAKALVEGKTGAGGEQEDDPTKILLKDYRPKSIYKIPVTKIERAKFPAIDMHSHPYAETPKEIEDWVKNMDLAGIEKTVILTMTTGTEFDEIFKKYSKHGERFEVWCGLALERYDKPGFGPDAVRELTRCHEAGARGVGEIHDKGKGLESGKSKAPGMHPDDARMDSLWDKCGELGMPVNIHVADPIWMYQKMDRFNDGLMNAYEWRLDNQPDIVDLPGMVNILELTAKKHRKTTFIACHFANLDYDLNRLGELLERNPNLYADISARYAETAPIPRFAGQFYARYADRLLYGTDMGFDKAMYEITFRILESSDEHFYEQEQFGYHWSLNGLALGDGTLRKVYRENAAKLLKARGRSG